MRWMKAFSFGNGPSTFSESTVSNTGLREFFGAHWVPGSELSEFLSAYYLCVNANSPSFSQNSPSSVCRRTQWVLSAETVLSKQYSARFLQLIRETWHVEVLLVKPPDQITQFITSICKHHRQAQDDLRQEQVRKLAFANPSLFASALVIYLLRAAKRGGFKRGFPDLDLSFLFCPSWDFLDIFWIFPICSGMVRGFSRFVLFLFLGLLRAPTRNSPERVCDAIWTFPDYWKWETSRFGNPPV